MSLKRIKEYPTKQQFESAEDYIERVRASMQEEAADRIKDFDILQLANVPWYDAREFGLKVGDDTTLASGNTTALQAAIDKAAAGTGNDAGGRVLLPEGIIQYDAMITMKNKVYLCGMGRESTQLKFTGTSGYAIYFGLSTAPPIGYYHMALMDFWLLGNATCTGGIHMYGGMYWNIERLRVSHFSKSTDAINDGHAFFFDDVMWEGALKSCFISHNNVGILEKRNSMVSFNAVSIEGMNNIRSNNYGIILGDPNDANQTLAGGLGSMISHNSIVYNVLGGIWNTNVFGLQIVGNYLEANGAFDIRVGSTEVDGNTLVTEGTSIRGNAIYASDDGEIGIDIIRGKQVATFHNYIMQAAVGINIGANSDYTHLILDFCDSSCAVKIADSGTNTTIFDQWGEVGVLESDIQFRDDFDDESIYWAWRNDGNTGTVTEADNVVTLSLANLADGRGIRDGKDDNPRLFTGVIGYPFIAECKLNSFTVNDGCSAGLYISMAAGYAHLDWYLIARDKDSNLGHDGLAVWAAGAYKATTAETTLPIWLRLRVGSWGGYKSDRIYGDYSLNGTDWTNLYSTRIDHVAPAYGNVCVGLFAENYLSYLGNPNAIAAPFEYFRMYRVWGP